MRLRFSEYCAYSLEVMGFLKATLLAILVIAISSAHGKSYGYSDCSSSTPSHTHSTCTETYPCYQYTILLTTDGSFSFSGDAEQFRKHHQTAGLDVVTEGKRVAAELKARYGVDATTLPDAAYVAPSVQLTHGVTFEFVTINPVLYMAAHRDQVQFYNRPTSVAFFKAVFSKDYVSNATGTFWGVKIPAGAMVYGGSFVVEACPYYFHHGHCLLSNEKNGRIFFTFMTMGYVLGNAPMIDSVLTHPHLGVGRSRGLFYTNPDGTTTGHQVLTFPDRCTNPANTCHINCKKSGK